MLHAVLLASLLRGPKELLGSVVQRVFVCRVGGWHICGMSLGGTRWGQIKGAGGRKSRWPGGVVSAVSSPLRKACE